MSREIVMGLEVHAELSTKSKIFCACTTGFGGEPNTHVCPVCSGMPGALPKLNRRVVDYAIRLGTALDCRITKSCKLDRKNYFYPDLPKAYQISQLYAPICQDGRMEIEAEGKKKIIRIREIHIEEDAGKLVHDPSGERTFMDFNRCGVPLLEIVSQPDFSTAAEVIAYLEKLREFLLYLGICDCKMQEGSLRADVNLSLRGDDGRLGVRSEMKNLNSFKAIARAIDYEAKRQFDVLEKGGTVTQETRRWDDNKGKSFGMRSKENAQDYRYFPEPDLLPLSIDDDWLERVKKSIPELAHEKRRRYIAELGVSEYESRLLTAHREYSALFEQLVEKSGQAVECAHLLCGEIMRLINDSGILPENLKLDSAKLASLVSLVSEGKINRIAYKKTVEAVFTHDVEPEAYINENGLMMLNDGDAVHEAVKATMEENPNAVNDYRNGTEKAFGFLMGQVMKRLGRAGNPNAVRKALKENLSK